MTEIDPEILAFLARRIAFLEAEIEIYRESQKLLPLPTAEEIEGMRNGALPLTQAEYLLGRLQASLQALEKVAGSLRTDLEGGLRIPPEAQHDSALLEAIEEAVARCRRSGR